MGGPGSNEAKQTAPRVLGRYTIYDAIASGGMATVHYGRLVGPVGFSRTVAIKRLHPQYAQDPDFVTMFLDEARMAARIRHPNVVATLDVVAEDSEIFLVMDYVHGDSLGQILRQVYAKNEKVPLNIALRIASDALQGLHAAHEVCDENGEPLNLIHRDISPQNILLGVDGVARLVDFGVAKAGGRAHATRDGNIKGKLSYMAPEQLRGLAITRQADIHAFAIVMWEMISGRRLFKADNEAEIIAAVMRHEVPPLSRFVPGIPLAVDAFVRRGVSVNVEKRYATAREMCIALEKCGPIAPSMLVADWVQAQMKDALDERSKIVGAIERDPGSSPNATNEISTTSAKAWVAHLSGHDLSEAAAESEALLAAGSGAAPPEAAPVITVPAPPPVAKAEALEVPVGGTPIGVAIPVIAATETPPKLAVSPDADLDFDSYKPKRQPVLSVPPEAAGIPRGPPRGLLLGAAALGALVLIGGAWAMKSSGDPAAVAPPRESASVAASPPPPPSAKPAEEIPEEAPPPAASAPTVPTATATAATHHRDKRPPKPDCNPPFTVDPQGVRVPKRECFQ